MPDAATALEGPLRARWSGSLRRSTSWRRAWRGIHGTRGAVAGTRRVRGVIFGAETPDGFARRWIPWPRRAARALVVLLDAERWRLAMFASDGGSGAIRYRLETKHVMLCAGQGARLIGGAAGTDSKAGWWTTSRSSAASRRIDGSAIYLEALSDAGQPPG